MQQRRYLLTLSKGGCRQTPPTIVWLGGSFTSVVVLTTSLSDSASVKKNQSLLTGN